jgi:hypothetical protein
VKGVVVVLIYYHAITPPASLGWVAALGETPHDLLGETANLLGVDGTRSSGDALLQPVRRLRVSVPSPGSPP